MKASTVVCTASLLLAMHAVFADAVKASGEYPEFYSGNSAKGIDFVQSIKVLTPRYCSNVKGSFKIVFEAKGMKLVDSEGRATTATVRLGNPDHPGAGDICALTTWNPKTRHHDKTKLHP